jgi:branched-chain amino acid transport system substrate-binding protein
MFHDCLHVIGIGALSLFLVAVSSPARVQAAEAASAPTKTLVLGAAVSKSGALAKEGGNLRDGYELWKDKVNAAGGIKIAGVSHKVEINYLDDRSEANTSVKLVEKFITEDKLMIILGPFGSGITNATSAIGERYKALTIASMANSDSIYKQGFKYTFGILPLASSQARPVLELAKDKGMKTIAIVPPDDLWPLTVAEGAKTMAERLGLQVVYFQPYPKGTNDLSSVINQIKAKSPDVMLGTGYLNEIALMTRQMKELKFNPKVVCFSGATTYPDYIKGLGKDTNGVFGLDWWTARTNWKGGLWKDAAEYGQEFEKRYSYPVQYISAAASAAGEVLRLALEKAGTTSPDKVREALLGLDTEIFFGQFKFDERGANVKGSSVAVQIVDGKTIVTWPKVLAEREPIIPKPGWGN